MEERGKVRVDREAEMRPREILEHGQRKAGNLFLSRDLVPRAWARDSPFLESDWYLPKYRRDIQIQIGSLILAVSFN